MNVPSKSELIHLKIQAAMRENAFADTDIKYLGEKVGHHWYLIDGKHKVRDDQFVDFEEVED